MQGQLFCLANCECTWSSILVAVPSRLLVSTHGSLGSFGRGKALSVLHVLLLRYLHGEVLADLLHLTTQIHIQ